jgi:hypothetical protein
MASPMRHVRIEDELIDRATAAASGAPEPDIIRAGLYAFIASSPDERAACLLLAKRRSGWPVAAAGGGEPDV